MSVIERRKMSEWDVILAEDTDDHALLIETALRKASSVPVKIRRAHNGEEAVGLIRDRPPSLLLLDLKMPLMAGHEVLKEIKGNPRLRSVPVVVLTSSDRDSDIAESYRLGGNHFMTKPSDPAELEEKFRRLLYNLAELRGIRRGSDASATTVQSAVDPQALLALNLGRWGLVAAVLGALFLFGRSSGVFSGDPAARMQGATTSPPVLANDAGKATTATAAPDGGAPAETPSAPVPEAGAAQADAGAGAPQGGTPPRQPTPAIATQPRAEAAAPQPAVPTTPAPPPSAGGDRGPWAVQLGAFSVEASARSLAAVRANAGLDTRVVRVRGNPLFRVRVGQFTDWESASLLVARIEDMGYAAVAVDNGLDEEPIG